MGKLTYSALIKAMSTMNHKSLGHRSSNLSRFTDLTTPPNILQTVMIPSSITSLEHQHRMLSSDLLQSMSQPARLPSSTKPPTW
jgi:hypothetical protein